MEEGVFFGVICVGFEASEAILGISVESRGTSVSVPYEGSSMSSSIDLYCKIFHSFLQVSALGDRVEARHLARTFLWAKSLMLYGSTSSGSYRPDRAVGLKFGEL